MKLTELQFVSRNKRLLMARRQGSAGRPWGRLRGQLPEDDELASLMRAQLDGRGATLDQLADWLTPERLGGRPVPSVATLSKRFAGEGLRNSGSLVRAVIEFCAPPSEVRALLERVDDLFRRAVAKEAAEKAGHRDSTADESTADEPDPTTEIRRLRGELDRERELRHRSESITALLVGLLAGGAGRPGVADPDPETARASAHTRAETDPRFGTSAQGAGEADEPSAMLPDGDDEELRKVVRWFGQQDTGGTRMVSAIRSAVDEALDGPGTGRYGVAQLDKYERTLLGHRVRSAFHRAFNLSAGMDLDFSIEGAEVELLFSVRRGGWLISRELLGRIVLLVYGDEERRICGVGLCRVTPAVLTGRPNRDSKQGIRRGALDNGVVWLADDATLPVSILLHLEPAAVQTIFAKRTAGERVEELARQARGQVIEGSAFAAVAMQVDYAKRLRDLKRRLVADGLLVLAGGNAVDRDRALRFGFPDLAPGQYLIAQSRPSGAGADER
jgi:hypothetical protein